MNERYPLALPAGSVLSGQYVIERVLGQGGFGITYCAKDHKSGDYVAVKEFFPDTMATRNQTSVVPYTGDRGSDYSYGKECFIQEAETLSQFIGVENIVRIYNYFEENGTAYFVMDYVEGMSFDDYIQQHGGRLSFEDTCKILAPVMDALAIVHSRGIIHRDVTPDNIFITNDGKVKLLDFGAARYSLGDRSQSLDVVLKHGFAPKEQYVRRGKQGPFTDVYALGATFYYALTGKRPPDAVDRMDVDELVPPSSLGVDIPQEAEQAILLALQVQPADRFQSITAFKNALGHVVESEQSDIGVTVSQKVFTASQQDNRNIIVYAQQGKNDILIQQNKISKTLGLNSLSEIYSYIDTHMPVVKLITSVLFLSLALFSLYYLIIGIGRAMLCEFVGDALYVISCFGISYAIWKNEKKVYKVSLAIGTSAYIILIFLLFYIGIAGNVWWFLSFVTIFTLYVLLVLREVKNMVLSPVILYALCVAREISQIVNYKKLYMHFVVELVAFILLITILTREQGGNNHGIN